VADKTPGTAIEGIIETFVTRQTSALTELDPALAPLAATAREAVLSPGKRLRPAFAYWGWRGAGGDPSFEKDVLPAIAALELLHAFALVHDDVMDRSDTRRGRPSAHRRLAAEHTRLGLRGDPDHFGDSGAILVGDLCLVWADRLIAEARIPSARLILAREGYDRMRAETIAGQFLDVFGESARGWGLAQALRTTRLKTAAYTVVRPLIFGAALAGRGDALTNRAYTRFGLAVGVAFQLRDDLLGLYGHEDVTGKPVGQDVTAGKPTLLLELARALASPGRREEIDFLVRSRDASAARKVAALVEEAGAVAKAEQMIGTRLAAAYSALAKAPITDMARKALLRLADKAVWRQR
jgi:geranylgeranyl diphosphate synthase, type I